MSGEKIIPFNRKRGIEVIPTLGKGLVSVEEKREVTSNEALRFQVLQVISPEKDNILDFAIARFFKNPYDDTFFKYCLLSQISNLEDESDLLEKVLNIDPLLKINEEFRSTILQTKWDSVLALVGWGEGPPRIYEMRGIWRKNRDRFGLNNMPDQRLSDFIVDSSLNESNIDFYAALVIEIVRRTKGKASRISSDHRNK